jgi:hypothetical protein
LTIKIASLRGAMRAARDAGLPRLFELETEFEERQLVAEMQYVGELVDAIAGGTLEGLEMWRSFHSADFDPDAVHFTFELPKE